MRPLPLRPPRLQEVPVAVPLSLPAATDKPSWDGKAKDVWAGVLFWVHVVCILIIACERAAR